MTRTGTYYWAIMNNRQDFEGKVVVDVGAGTGILSLFAAQVPPPPAPPPRPSRYLVLCSRCGCRQSAILLTRGLRRRHTLPV